MKQTSSWRHGLRLLSSSCSYFGLVALVVYVMSTAAVLAQQPQRITAVQMSKWDGSLAAAIDWTALGLFILAAVLPFVVIAFRVNWDWRLDILKRSLLPGIALAIAALLSGGPLFFEGWFGWLFRILKVDPAYFEHLDVTFAYRPLLWGAIGGDAPVGARPARVFAILLVAPIAGALAALALHFILRPVMSPSSRTQPARKLAREQVERA